jgi:hypothetical protein
MGYFKKKTDPVSDRAKSLNAEIAVLEAQIRKLTTDLDQTEPRRVCVRQRCRKPSHRPTPPSPRTATRFLKRWIKRGLKTDKRATKGFLENPANRLGVCDV